jgi:hypothetical protein
MGRIAYQKIAKQGLTASMAAAGLLLSACAAPAYVSPVEVTRFAAPPAQMGAARLGQGTISLRAAPGVEEGLEFGIYRAAVANELERLGYRVVPDMGAQVATIAIEEFVSQPGRDNGPVSVGGSAGTGSWGSGVGLGVGINLNSLGGPPPDRIDRQLSVTIRGADAPANLWEGRAHFVATTNSAFAQDAPAASRAASALFQGFPGTSGETIEVE